MCFHALMGIIRPKLWSETAHCVAALSTVVLLLADPLLAADLKVMSTGLGSGTITSTAPGISCGADCEEAYARPDVVTLTATAATESVFTGWEAG